MFPNKYARVGTSVHCLPGMFQHNGKNAKWVRRALLATDDGILASKSKFSNFSQKSAKLTFAKIEKCTYTCCACYSTFSHNSKCHFLKWKSAATAVLSAQRRNGRMLSMAAKPFILTIDNARLFCYLSDI